MEQSRLILTPPQMRTAELAATAHGITVENLMQNAGEALGRLVLSTAQRLMKRNILVICGVGNNGGDGFVAVDFLLKSAANVTVVLCGTPKTDLSKTALARIKGRCEMMTLEQAVENLAVIDQSEIIVDCVFGIGFHGVLSHDLQRLFLRCSLGNAYRIACDAPSGINCMSGRISPNAFEADETMTFHRPKLGMVMSPAKERCGKISPVDIGIGDYIEEYAKVQLIAADKAMVRPMLPYRVEDSHKGVFGKVVLVCGSTAYPGAAMISAGAALRSGVGMVNLCTHEKVITPAVARMPECTFTPLCSDGSGYIGKNALEDILKATERGAGACVIGCGLGRTEELEELVCELIRRVKIPLIIDADGINCLSLHIDVLKEKQTEIVLTPHPAELARLCGTDTASVTQDLFGHACEIAEQYGVTVHAKNTQTLTVKDKTCYITDFGCSALAKGGSGDMLAGLIGGFVAQGVTVDRACVLADYVMGTSARELCENLSPRGVVAGDIISHIPRVLYELEHDI